MTFNLSKRLRLSDKAKKQDLTVFYILPFETYTLNTKTQMGYYKGMRKDKVISQNIKKKSRVVVHACQSS